jgi:hypothetical protein
VSEEEEEEEEAPGMSEEEPAPTSPPSCLSQRRAVEWCGGDWSFTLLGAMEQEQCGLREKQTSRSGLRPTSS